MIAILVTIVLGVLAISGSVYFVYRAGTSEGAAKFQLLAIQEKRRILERDRAEWKVNLRSEDRQCRVNGTKNIKVIDDLLLDLADEEADARARLHRSRKETPDGSPTSQD